MADVQRPYHHGQIDRVAIDGAVAEVETVGVAAVSMRRIARRAGVSHAALAYKFGDKTGIFTAVATEGFRLQAEMIRAAATDGFLSGGQAYIAFALTHRGYFEVMFRPNLYRGDDLELMHAKSSAFDVLYATARTDLTAGLSGQVTDDEVQGLALAGWSLCHGFATLAATSNFPEHADSDLSRLAAQIAQGVVAMGDLTRQQMRHATDDH
ncbi:TetR/AcrR family transcriptional regulator [Gordonia oryzae]|uniref:TetR/AcrR family transcriptional regulator n=1 Tax=Gordonia oryzae TaxID=2487349 RepID=A0A3N4GT30_9ACTN|nr:TetR/AcrR family transcriptional regulator [Gordonia oryzae]RPA66183.1 TetR/AcrR family transcriptional regulator [Gordonia oryzae]